MPGCYITWSFNNKIQGIDAYTAGVLEIIGPSGISKVIIILLSYNQELCYNYDYLVTMYTFQTTKKYNVLLSMHNAVDCIYM